MSPELRPKQGLGPFEIIKTIGRVHIKLAFKIFPPCFQPEYVGHFGSLRSFHPANLEGQAISDGRANLAPVVISEVQSDDLIDRNYHGVEYKHSSCKAENFTPTNWLPGPR